MLPPNESDTNFYTTASIPSLPIASDEYLIKRPKPPAALATAADTASEAAALVEIDEFCRYVGRRLRALDPETRLQVQFQILQIIIDAESGEL